MKQKSRGIIVVLLLLTVLSSSCGGDPPTPAPKESTAPKSVESPPVLQIEERRLTRADFMDYLSSRYPDLELNTAKPGLQSRLFDNFVEYQILRYRAEQTGVTVTSDELPDLIEKLHLPADSLPRPVLIEMARIQKYLYFNYFRQQEVSETEIRDYYQRHRGEFRQEAEVHLYQILVSSNEKAIEIRGILQNNPDQFEDLAATRSISPEASNKGYMGTFARGTLPEEMENVVFSLRPHQISPVVESKFGFHIFKVTSRSNRRTLPLQRVRERIRSDLMSRKLRAAYKTMLQDARDTLQVSQFPKNLEFEYTSETGDQSHETD